MDKGSLDFDGTEDGIAIIAVFDKNAAVNGWRPEQTTLRQTSLRIQVVL